MRGKVLLQSIVIGQQGNFTTQLKGPVRISKHSQQQMDIRRCGVTYWIIYTIYRDTSLQESS